MKEIGSFLELEFPVGLEFYTEQRFGINNIVRLNTGRSAILYAINHYGKKLVYMPKYQCESVVDFIQNHNIELLFYNIDEYFVPQIDNYDENSAIVIVNYYGIFGTSYLNEIRKKYKNIIIDNAQAFFSCPIPNALNCYSARKFVGVPDGAYVIGENIIDNISLYEQDFSSDTALFLLQRIEYGCEGKAYNSRKENEKRLDGAGIRKMSKLTHTILDGYDYQKNMQKRRNNFNLCMNLFEHINVIDVQTFVDENCFPYVYPLLIEKDGIIEKLHENKIFQGHWWEYLVEQTSPDSFEHRLSQYIIPVTIDYRYNADDMHKQYDIICEALDEFNE